MQPTAKHKAAADEAWTHTGDLLPRHAAFLMHFVSGQNRQPSQQQQQLVSLPALPCSEADLL
jgi:hypothetical protein